MIQWDDGNCKHEVWTVKEDSIFNKKYGQRKGVWMANEDDSHYVQRFSTPHEVNEFIEQLTKARIEVFGQ